MNRQPSDTLQLKATIAVEDASRWPLSTQSQTIARLTGNDRFDEEMILARLSTRAKQDSFNVSGQVETWLTSYGTEFFANEDTTLQTVWRAQNSSSVKLLKLAAFRTRPQQSLRLEKTPLLISDIELSNKIAVQSDSPSPKKGELYIEPYPYRRVRRAELLYLYFEIYGLQLSESETANYRIAYEAEDSKSHENVWSKIKSVFGGRAGAGEITLESDYVAQTANPREWIGLDLSSLPRGRSCLRSGSQI